MQNDPASPDYDSSQSENEPIDRDNDQYAQDAGSQVGFGQEAGDDILDASSEAGADREEN